MAEQVYENIRLDADLTGNLPTNTYSVLVEGFQDVEQPLAETERSLTGKLLVHRLMDGSTPKTTEDHHYKLHMTNAEKEQLEADVGKNVYFMPHRRDEGAGYASYRTVIFFERMENKEPLDNLQEYWNAEVFLRDNQDGSV